MNLYDLHTDPTSLYGHNRADMEVPAVFFDKDKPKEREAAIAKSPEYALLYAMHVLYGPFPAGEAVIAKDPKWAYYYARDILQGGATCTITLSGH